jgi:hypothetical protein
MLSTNRREGPPARRRVRSIQVLGHRNNPLSYKLLRILVIESMALRFLVFSGLYAVLAALFHTLLLRSFEKTAST